jgi:hypothetical protein
MQRKIVEVQLGASYADTRIFLSDLELAPNDVVVCDEGFDYLVGKVLSVRTETVYDSPKGVKRWIVCKVDDSAHKARLERERKITEIKLKMTNRKQELGEGKLYEILAEKDEVMKELLQEYKELLESN